MFSLKVFRDNLKYFSWLLWIVIAAFILFYIPDFMAPQGTPTTAAMVGEQEISYTELQRAYRNLEDRFRQAYQDSFTPELAEQLQLDQQALNQLINQKVMLLEARRLGLRVSDEELSEEIVELFSDADGRFVGEQQYLRYVRSQNLTVGGFEEGIRESLLMQKLDAVLRQNLYVSEEEVEEAYRESVERASIRYLQVPASRFAEEVEVTEEEVASYFEENREDYRLPERRDADFLLVDVNQLRTNLPVEEGDLYSYYQENEDEFVIEEQVRARHILLNTQERSVEEARAELETIKDRIEGGEGFAAVAREVSEDPGSASQGGDLGYFGRGQMTPEFEEAAFAAETGKVVGPVVSPFGVHLIQVEDRREGGQQPFAEVRSRIQMRLASERAPEEAERRARQLREMIGELEQVTPDSLQALAQEAGPEVTLQQPQPFSRQEAVPGLGRPQGLMDQVFEMGPGQVSDPVQVPRGWVIAYVEDTLEPRDRELEEVEEEIRQDISQRKQRQRAVERLAEAKEAIEGGETLETVAGELEIELREAPEFGPQGVIQGLGYNAKVAQAALSMEEGEVGGPFEGGDGAVLFEVTGRTTWDPQEFENQAETLRARLEQQKMDQLLSSLLRERRRELEVRIFDPELQGTATAQG